MNTMTDQDSKPGRYVGMQADTAVFSLDEVTKALRLFVTEEEATQITAEWYSTDPEYAGIVFDENVDITDDPAAARQLKDRNAGEAATPTVLLHGGIAGEDQDRMLTAPSDTQLDMTLDELGLLPLKDEGDGSPGLSRGSAS